MIEGSRTPLNRVTADPHYRTSTITRSVFLSRRARPLAARCLSATMPSIGDLTLTPNGTLAEEGGLEPHTLSGAHWLATRPQPMPRSSSKLAHEGLPLVLAATPPTLAPGPLPLAATLTLVTPADASLLGAVLGVTAVAHAGVIHRSPASRRCCLSEAAARISGQVSPWPCRWLPHIQQLQAQQWVLAT